MAKVQFNFDAKIEIQMPKVEGKIETQKMKQAVKKAIVKGAQKGATYVQKDLRGVLDSSITRVGAVDTGRLKDSLEIRTKFSQTKVGFSIIYKTPYAAFVHYGGVMRPYGNPNAATVTIAGRPWIKMGLKNYDIKKPFDRGISEAWKAQFGS